MPTENVLNRNFKEVFTSKVRLEIPFFQRGYSWEIVQWKTLLNDIEEQILNEVQNNNFEEAEHFFGPVVVLEKTNSHPDLKRYLVIDGQQRITTVYIMLIVIKNIFIEKAHISPEANGHISEIEKLITNQLSNTTDTYLNLKVYSSKGDRLPTYLAIFNENPTSPFLAADQQLYQRGQNNIDRLYDFLYRTFKNYDVPKLWQISQAITKSLKIVWIPLNENKDDPQAIFESLNDKGMPLSASELLCNYLFKPLTDEINNSHEQLHNEKWLSSQKEIGNEYFENYLRNLFSIGEPKMIGKDRRVYIHFKSKNRNLSKASAISYLNNISDNVKIYKQITNPIRFNTNNSNLTKVIIDINATSMYSVYPFLLSLLKSYYDERIDLKGTLELLSELYILLVRRKVVGLPTTKYDVVFPSLLQRIINEPDKLRAFHEIIYKENLFVPNQIFIDCFLEREIYNSKDLAFGRHILQKIDMKLQLHNEFPDYTTINTIEHIMPQSLSAEWLQYLGEEANNINLTKIKNTIGNLCLNSTEANSAYGNNLFENKILLYNDITALQKMVKLHTKKWNIKAIQERSENLAKVANEIWSWQYTLI